MPKIIKIDLHSPPPPPPWNQMTPLLMFFTVLSIMVQLIRKVTSVSCLRVIELPQVSNNPLSLIIDMNNVSSYIMIHS